VYVALPAELRQVEPDLARAFFASEEPRSGVAGVRNTVRANSDALVSGGSSAGPVYDAVLPNLNRIRDALVPQLLQLGHDPEVVVRLSRLESVVRVWEGNLRRRHGGPALRSMPVRPIETDVTTASGRPTAWYMAAALAASVVHPFLPAPVRPLWFVAVIAATVGPTVVAVRRSPAGSRLPWWLLLLALLFLMVGNGAGSVVDTARATGDALLTLGHAFLLAGTVVLVLRRGRKDVGGMIDVSIVAVGLGSLLWTGLMQPRLVALNIAVDGQAAILATTFVLAGLLGALGRLWRSGGQRLAALMLMVVALSCSLVGNVALAMSNGVLTIGRPPWAETLFLLAYCCLGGAALHPSALELMRPGPASADQLGATRLVFLGAAIALSPVTAGVRQLAGLPADGLLVTAGTLAIVPLVMLRIGSLAAERRRAELALVRQATIDALTGLPNRAEFLARLDATLQSSRAAGDLAVLFCDLNGFKEVNDRLGHAAGDELLAQVATRLSAAVRSNDTVARFGGDEFLIMCEATSRDDVIERLCPRLREALSDPFRLSSGDAHLGASVGIVFAGAESGLDELIDRADAAMYQAKQRHEAKVGLAVAFA
jgi:diguanylate cyclase